MYKTMLEQQTVTSQKPPKIDCDLINAMLDCFIYCVRNYLLLPAKNSDIPLELILLYVL